MTQSLLDLAQDILRDRLKDIFGPDLKGVVGFGAGLDRATKSIALKVAVDSPTSALRAETLPKTIEGLPVTVQQRAAARGGAH